MATVKQLLALPPPPDALCEELEQTPPFKPSRATFEETFSAQALSLNGKINSVPIAAAHSKLSAPRVEILPVVLTHKRTEYPMRVSFCCYYCKCKYSTRPVGVPFKVDLKRNIFQCEGFYCGYNCAMRAAKEDKSTKIREQSPSMLVIMARRVSGIREEIVPSLPFYLLKAFGGTLTPKEYHASRLAFKVVAQRARVIPFGFNAYRVESAMLIGNKRKKHVVRTAGYISKQRKEIHNLMRMQSNVKSCVRGALFEAKRSKRRVTSIKRPTSKIKVYDF